MVDRVDQLNGQWRILDYKTGKVEAKDLSVAVWEDLISNTNKAKAFQLMLYAYLFLKNNHHIKNAWAGNFSFKNQKEGLLCLKKKRCSKTHDYRRRGVAIFREAIKRFNY